MTSRYTNYQSSPKNICRNNRLKQPPETYRSNKRHYTNQQTTEQQEDLRTETKRKTIKQPLLYLILQKEMMLPARINIFYSKVTIKTT